VKADSTTKKESADYVVASPLLYPNVIFVSVAGRLLSMNYRASLNIDEDRIVVWCTGCFYVLGQFVFDKDLRDKGWPRGDYFEPRNCRCEPRRKFPSADNVKQQVLREYGIWF